MKLTHLLFVALATLALHYGTALATSIVKEEDAGEAVSL